MTWEPRPMPYVTGETEQYWQSAADGKLLYRQCNDCGLAYHYPRALCPDCLSGDVDWRKADGTGKVFTFTIMRQLAGWPEDDLPVVVAYVELDEGPRLMTNVVGVEYTDIEVSDRVQVQFVDTKDDDIAIPVFEPVK